MSSNLQLHRNLVSVSGFGYRENALLCGNSLSPGGNIEASTRPGKFLLMIDRSSSSNAPMVLSGISHLLGGRWSRHSIPYRASHRTHSTCEGLRRSRSSKARSVSGKLSFG